MSSLLLSTSCNNQINPAKIAQQLKFAANSWSQEFSINNLLAVCTRVDDRKLWASYHDVTTNTLILLGGRVAFEPEEWAKLGKNNEYEAMVAHEILSRYQNLGISALTELNGGYCVIIYEANKAQLTLCTDRLGIYPIYGYGIDNPDKFILCTHPDVLAQNLNSWTPDFVTMAELLRTSQGVHPYTFYQEIKELDSGSLYTWNLKNKQFNHQRYWTPEPQPLPKSQLTELTLELAEGLSKAVERRTQPILGKVGVFLSGGTDSRIPLFAASNRNGLTGITFYDGDNRELAVAKSLANRAQAEHLLIQRDLDYYPRVASEVMRIAGGMWNFTDGHYHGGLNEINNMQFGSIISGCYADCLFKGLLLNKNHYSFFGKKLPFVTRGKFDFKYYLWHKPVAEKWRVKISERLGMLYQDAMIPPKNDLDLMIIEIHRLIPVSRIDSAARNVLWRSLPWDPFFCDKDLLDLYFKIPISLKLNGTLYNHAVAHLCKEANDIPNGNTGVAINSSSLAKINATIVKPWILEKIGYSQSQAANPPYASHNLWPNWSYVISHSPVIQNLWLSMEQETIDLITELLGWNPWSITTQEWGVRDPEFFTRILSLSLWHSGTKI